MNRKINKVLWLAGILALSLSSCTKNALEQKTDQRLAVATTLDDFQQLLNGLGGYNSPAAPMYLTLGSYMSDDLYLTDANYNSMSSSPVGQKIYTWDKTMFNTNVSVKEWDDAYRVVLNANLAIEGVGRIAVTPANQKAWNNVMGSALLIRSSQFLDMAQFWAPLYQSSTAATDLGIVLKLSSDLTATLTRATVADTYKQIISDLQTAAALLPNTSAADTKASKAQPSKAAAYGLLARTYLAMGDYPHVKLYADSALQLYSALMDYNVVLVSGRFENFNDEMVYLGSDNGGTGGYPYSYSVDSALIKSYDANDLRFQLFFYPSGTNYNWQGDYTGYLTFTGLANDELYLLRAEANARAGQTSAAMDDLNTLLVKRWVTGTFTPLTATDADDALQKVLTERRKELILRGTRWTDLRRLNQDPRFVKTVTRTVAGTTYTLAPNDSRYTLQIPSYIIAFNGIKQNP